MSWSASRRLIGAGSVAAITAGMLAAASPGASGVHWSGSAASAHVQRVVALGSTRFAAGSLVASRNTENASPRSHVVMTSELKIPRNAKSRAGKAPSSAATVATGNAVTDTRPSGFDGLTHRDQRLSDNGNQFTVEPPDQGLCVHNGQVLESINNAFTVYDTTGSSPQHGAIISLNEFFTGDKALDRTDPNNPIAGKFLSDPKCLFDQDTQRWFMTILEADVLPVGTNTTSHQLVAVSDTSDATGTWKIFSFDTTDDGSSAATGDHPNCPCFGDQPLLGEDSNGLYITTNEFGDLGGFNGAQVYALDKHALASTGTSSVVAFDAGDDIQTPDTGGIWYSVQPTVTPADAAPAGDGTEYFASALQFGPSNFDNRIALWRMTGTDTLSAAKPNVELTVQIVNTEVYGNPVPMTQRENASLRPLGKSVKEPVETVDSNDDRMNQAVFADGRVWTALNTMVLNGNGKQHTAIAWFAINPAAAPSITKQGYVALSQDQNVAFPAIAVNNAGKGVIGFSVMGPNLYPSTGYVRVSASGVSGAVHLNALGSAPEDGDSGYRAFGGAGDARWGDYSAAVVAEDGSVWLGQEYVPNAPRTGFANWGTFIGHVAP